jgi:hypothetical protein
MGSPSPRSKWMSDAAHGAAAQALIADEARLEHRAGHDTRHEARGRAAVAAVEIATRRPQSVQAAARDPQVAGERGDRRAERAKHARRGLGVGGAQDAADARRSVGDGGEDEGAVGDGLVAGNADVPAHPHGA